MESGTANRSLFPISPEKPLQSSDLLRFGRLFALGIVEFG
jgi:hypothetical protein